MQAADEVVFLNPKDQRAAEKAQARLKGEKRRLPRSTNIPVPPTGVVLAALSPSEVLERPKDILVFGLIREGKGGEQAMALAKEIQSQGVENMRVQLVGAVTNIEYLVNKVLKPLCGMKKKECKGILSAWHGAVVLTESKKKDLADRLPEPKAVLDDILARESGPLQLQNRKTLQQMSRALGEHFSAHEVALRHLEIYQRS